MTVWTIGHSTRSLDEFTALLKPVAIDLLADVRSVPRSRTNPQYNRDTLPAALRAQGIGYRHLAALGGLRKARPESSNTLWRNESFRGYADYALTPAFHSGIEELQALVSRHRVAIMCAEAVWWRCHRRIIADYLLVAGERVEHILAPGKIDPARLTPGAVAQPDGSLIYAAEQTSLI
jgi:uncharacterized protein (DUF488 family)